MAPVEVALAQVPFCDTAGCRVLEQFCRHVARYNVRLRIANPGPIVARMFRLLGDHQLLGATRRKARREPGR